MSINVRTVGVWLLIAVLTAAFFPTSAIAGKGGSGGGHGSAGGWGGHGGGDHSLGSPQGGHGTSSWSGHGPSGPGRSENWNHAGADHHAGDWHGNSHGDWHGGDWHNGHGGWDSGHAWWHEHGPSWVGWWQVGFGWPWFGFGWRPGYYGFYYGAPYYGDIYADYGYEAAPYAAAYPPAETADTTTPPADGEATEFYAQALAAFQQGDYRNATRLAGHASIDDPRNPDVHVLLMQGLFAIGEYRGAAMEAHAVVSLGKTPDWTKLYGLYGAVEPYTEQLRALEKYAGDKPSSAEGQFLLGFQYLMTGHPEAAQNDFLQALKLTPKDRLAAQLLKEVGGTVPPEIAKQLSPSPPLPKTFDSAKKGR